MQNPPTDGSRGACQLGGDSAPYSPNQNQAQTAATTRRCATCRHFLDYAEANSRGECRHRSPRLADAILTEARWPQTWKNDWCGDWEAAL